MNNYMGPVATKVMKGYSDEDISTEVPDFKVMMMSCIRPDMRVVFFLNVDFLQIMIACDLFYSL